MTASKQNTQTKNTLRSDMAFVNCWVWPLQHHAVNWSQDDFQLQVAQAGQHRWCMDLSHIADPDSRKLRNCVMVHGQNLDNGLHCRPRQHRLKALIQ